MSPLTIQFYTCNDKKKSIYAQSEVKTYKNLTNQ